MKQYAEMIEDAILTLNERSGSSRQGIWKCLNAKYPEADYKQFLIRLKKLSKEGPIIQNKGRFKIE